VAPGCLRCWSLKEAEGRAGTVRSNRGRAHRRQGLHCCLWCSMMITTLTGSTSQTKLAHTRTPWFLSWRVGSETAFNRWLARPRLRQIKKNRRCDSDAGGVLHSLRHDRLRLGEKCGYLEGYRGVEDTRFGRRVYLDGAHIPCFSYALDVPSGGVDTPPVG
jgi:hypothetical protein